MNIKTKKFRLSISFRFSLGLLFNVLIATTVYSQKEITVADYLHTIRESGKVKGNSSKLSFLSEYNYRLPLVKGVQLRSETNDFLFDRQEFSMRIQPTSLSAITKQKRLYKNKLEKATLENRLHFNEQLEKRYFQIVNYVFVEELTELIKERYNQLMDKSRILKESMYEINFEVTDLIDVEDQLTEIEQKLKNLKQTQQQQQSEMKGIVNDLRDSIRFNYDDLIAPEEVIKKSKNTYSSALPLEVRIQKLELRTMIDELELSSVKSNQLLDFVQLKYQGGDNFIFQENISVGIGFNLDFTSNRKRKGDYYFDKLREEIKLTKLEEEKNFAQKEKILQFKKAVDNFVAAQNKINNGSIIPIYKIYQNMEGAPPLLLLKLNLLLNDKKIETAEAKHELYTTYIKTLSVQEILFRKPLRNHLSNTNTYIKP